MAERNLDFDTVINRKNTDCLKYDFAVKRGMPEDVLPLWVADMDFKTSSYVEDAIVERARDAIFGYSEVSTPYFNILSKWMIERHGWQTKENWLIKTPGVVFAIAAAVKAFTHRGDAVLLQSPIYYPFYEVIEDNERKVVSSDLILGEDNRYHIDFDDFEKKITENDVKLFFLCNPHNPVGRVWTKEELTRLGDICVEHGVLVISDEIHHDFVFKGEHTVFASIKKEFEDISITCTSPSKTFNLASMLISNIFIPNTILRKKFEKQVAAVGISQLSVLGLVATEVAYEKGGEWYDAMIEYIRGNIEFAKEYVKENLPGVNMIDTEGTYLIWLDFRNSSIDVKDLDDKIINEAKLWLDSGKIFGHTGEGFERINVACPRSVLKEALERLSNLLENNSRTDNIIRFQSSYDALVAQG
ncbi:MAG: pyridoxal phosphate-dependent aminotransferase [Lachnospiraceae bacterium]|nr:pyridoxal phosphate-dependent aminotransferase [Lachnospiraceae bacterium]